MNTLHVWTIFSFIFTLALWRAALPKPQENTAAVRKLTIQLLFLLALVLRVVLSTSYAGFGADLSCFSGWADRMAELGPGKFYSPNYFSDYPPLYLYVLYLIGLLKRTFGLTSYSPMHLFLLKLPAILSDLGIGYVIYRAGAKRIGLRSSLCLASIYLFQPVVVMNSCLWGQIDSVFTLFVVLVCLFLDKNNLLPAMLFFGLGMLLKPQMLIFSPVLILGMILYVFRGSFSLHGLLKVLGYGLLTLAVVLLIASPFGLKNVIPQYVDTLSSYPYASVNAYNFWTGMGLNWNPQTTPFLGLPCSTWGSLAIVLATVFGILLGLRLAHVHGKYSLVGAFLIITVFTFSVRMHERYLYPMTALLLLAFEGLAARQLCATPAREKDKGFSHPLTPSLQYVFPILYAAFVCLHFMNVGHVLFFYDPAQYSAKAPILLVTGIGMTLCTIFFYGLLIRLQSPKEYAVTPVRAWMPDNHGKPLRIPEEHVKMTRLDALLLLAIVLFYSLFALRDLGDRKAPETVFTCQQGETLHFTFPKEHPVSSFSYYVAPEHNRQFRIDCQPAEGTLTDPLTENENSALYTLKNVFTWQSCQLPTECSSIDATLQEGTANLIELVFLDRDGAPVVPTNASDYANLFDEHALYPDQFSFRSSMYFDEIYHGRTAYEFIHGLRSYENTHPPLGKILISLGVSLFGMNPFGWRIIGVLFGIAMLPILYLFAKRLTGDTPVSALTCFIFAFDFMHFTQTRLATIDVFIVFFVICMYYFLYVFFSTDYATAPLGKLFLPLGLCGISMGLGVACKWTGVYAGLGMGLLFFGYLYGLANTWSRTRQSKRGHADQNVLFTKALWQSPFGRRTKKIILFCLVFFVLIPAMIYFASYVPFRDGSDHGLIKQALDNQNTMFSYHSKLEATHYFASPFYEWPLIIRPIWYYKNVLSDTVQEGISSFGNPLVWWAGIPAFCYMIYLFLKKKDRRALFLIIGYFAQYLPWFFVSRLTFIYHYFPSVVFLVLMIGYAFRNLKEVLPGKCYVPLVLLYALLVFGLFLLFYPVLAGQPVELAFAEKYLKWFKTWVLVSR